MNLNSKDLIIIIKIPSNAMLITYFKEVKKINKYKNNNLIRRMGLMHFKISIVSNSDFVTQIYSDFYENYAHAIKSLSISQINRIIQKKKNQKFTSYL